MLTVLYIVYLFPLKNLLGQPQLKPNTPYLLPPSEITSVPGTAAKQDREYKFKNPYYNL